MNNKTLQKGIYVHGLGLFDKQYTPRGEVDKETLKSEVLDDYTDCLPVMAAFQRADFDLDRFFLEDDYKLIDDDIRCHLFVDCLRLVKPISDYVVEWMDGYLEFGYLEKNEAVKCGKDNHPVCNDDIFKYLYFCRMDEEIWDLLSLGFGEIEKLFLWYMGIDTSPAYTVDRNGVFRSQKDEAKAKRLLDYILTESPYTIDEVRSEILGQMEYDDLSKFIKHKNKGIKRYQERAESKKVADLEEKWRLFSMSDDPRLRKDAVKYLVKAFEYHGI